MVITQGLQIATLTIALQEEAPMLLELLEIPETQE
jgi:hypothetical protein